MPAAREEVIKVVGQATVTNSSSSALGPPLRLIVCPVKEVELSVEVPAELVTVKVTG